MTERRQVDKRCFRDNPELPYSLRVLDFESAMQDVYDFFADVNGHLAEKHLSRLDDMLRPAICSGIVSDMLTESLAKHSRALVANAYHNGHPDLVVRGAYPNDAARAGEEGIEIKSTRQRGGAVDTHGARRQWMCVFVYEVDQVTEPATQRHPLAFREVYLAQVEPGDFRRNDRGELGTRTATLHAAGVTKLRNGWIYFDREHPPYVQASLLDEMLEP